MPKRPRSPSTPDSGGDRRPPEQQDLYLIFDDWLWGYSIRELDLSSDDAEEDEEGTKHALPPPIFRMEAPREWTMSFTAAIGTMIIAMHDHDDESTERGIHPLVPELAVPIFDVRDRGVIFVLRPNQDTAAEDAVYIPAGDDSLYAFTDASFQMLDRKSSLPCSSQCSAGTTSPPLPCPCLAPASWRHMPPPVFRPCHYVSSAVHPDGETIFVTVASFPYSDTYAFSEKDGWEPQGVWKLPFSGRGHFDPELNAWVGICSYYRGFGHLCACDLVLPKTGRDRGGLRPAPDWKLGKEKLFSEVPGERHLGATLLYMGAGSRFCLVECVYIEHSGFKDDKLYEKLRLRYEYLLRVTTFSLKYDDNRDLTVGNSRQLRYYAAPEAATRSTLKDPVAFWM